MYVCFFLITLEEPGLIWGLGVCIKWWEDGRARNGYVTGWARVGLAITDAGTRSDLLSLPS